jgi:hypothetical protein
MKARIEQPQADARFLKHTWLIPRLVQVLTVLAAFWSAAEAYAETKLDFWHSYTHQPDGVIHYSFHIANYKRGLFFGSCGPSTRSLQWGYDVDLAGGGPTYATNQVAVSLDGKKVEVVSGTIRIDLKQREASIDLRVKVDGAVINFLGNGIHHVGKAKS